MFRFYYEDSKEYSKYLDNKMAKFNLYESEVLSSSNDKIFKEQKQNLSICSDNENLSIIKVKNLEKPIVLIKVLLKICSIEREFFFSLHTYSFIEYFNNTLLLGYLLSNTQLKVNKIIKNSYSVHLIQESIGNLVLDSKEMKNVFDIISLYLSGNEIIDLPYCISSYVKYFPVLYYFNAFPVIYFCFKMIHKRLLEYKYKDKFSIDEELSELIINYIEAYNFLYKKIMDTISIYNDKNNFIAISQLIHVILKLNKLVYFTLHTQQFENLKHVIFNIKEKLIVKCSKSIKLIYENETEYLKKYVENIPNISDNQLGKSNPKTNINDINSFGVNIKPDKSFDNKELKNKNKNNIKNDNIDNNNNIYYKPKLKYKYNGIDGIKKQSEINYTLTNVYKRKIQKEKEHECFYCSRYNSILSLKKTIQILMFYILSQSSKSITLKEKMELIINLSFSSNKLIVVYEDLDINVYNEESRLVIFDYIKSIISSYKQNVETNDLTIIFSFIGLLSLKDYRIYLIY